MEWDWPREIISRRTGESADEGGRPDIQDRCEGRGISGVNVKRKCYSMQVQRLADEGGGTVRQEGLWKFFCDTKLGSFKKVQCKS